MSTTEIINCPACKKKLRVPSDKGTILATCPVCKYKFHYYGTAPKANVKPPQSKTPVSSGSSNVQKPTPPVSSGSYNNVKKPTPPTTTYEPQTPTRTVTIRRLMHAYKDLSASGLKNMFVDAAPVAIYLDGEKKGSLQKDQPMVLHIDSNRHELSCFPIGGQHKLPAGNDSFEAFFFNNGFKIGMVNDPFRDELAAWVLNMVRGQGFKDRIMDSNNHYHAVEISIQSNYIRVHWRLNQTKGFAEWSTGEKEEKIYYSHIGLTLPPEDRQPGGYWDFLNSYVQEVVTNDPKADLEHVIGGFTFRKNHSLY